jgi:superkiller protein 3
MKWQKMMYGRTLTLTLGILVLLPLVAAAQNSSGNASSIPTADAAKPLLSSGAGLDRELSTDPAGPLIKTGLTLFSQQKWTEAEAQFRTALQTNPRSLSAQLWLGYTLFRQARYPDAETVFKQLAGAQPSVAARQANLGESLLEQQKWAEAERAYVRAAELEATNPLWQYFLGFVVFAQKRVDESETYLRRAVELEPRNAGWFADFAAAQVELGKWKNAEAAYRQAIFISDEPRWHNGLSNALFNQGKTTTAIAELQLAIERAPQVALFHINLGNLYTKLQKWPEAERALREGVALKSDQAGWHALLATALYQQQKYRDAANSYKEAIRLRPNDALSHFNLGVIYLNLGDKRSAQAELDKLKPLDQRLATKLNDLIQGKTPAGN